ncbi:N-acetyltransferase family protein [Streptococcus panodentis]|uniref:GNAT family N-acetyltransferase n=1 Tax=Streptococcus panodentis TaxID=1581472 RepID=A0ABS5AXV3_9STRE|nr:GNAT family N-acetyltransferase [Streptococcus panodentis]MBP2621400.1 GNAT family N-acetyltransferase [Streptococcus panodentis]
MAQFDLSLREAERADAADLIAFLNQVGSESDYMTLDEAGILMNEAEMSSFIERQADSANQLYLLALLNDDIAGLVSITADFHERIRHIGQVFVVVKKAFWNQGMGRILLDEAVAWAQESGILRRLELTVQVRNERAVHLYKDLGFEIEGLLKRGAYLKEGKFLDVYLMGKLIDK